MKITASFLAALIFGCISTHSTASVLYSFNENAWIGSVQLYENFSFVSQNFITTDTVIPSSALQPGCTMRFGSVCQSISFVIDAVGAGFTDGSWGTSALLTNKPGGSTFYYFNPTDFSATGTHFSPINQGYLTVATIPANALLASVIGAYGNAIQFIQTQPTIQQLENNLINCPSTPGCDIDAAQKQLQDYENQGIGLVQNAAVSSENLVNETGFNPLNPADLITAVITHAKDWINNLVDLFDLFKGTTPEANKNISVTNATGSGYQFSASNYDATLYNLDITAQLDDAELQNLQVGTQFFNNEGLGYGNLAFGVGTIQSVIDPPRLGTVEIQLSQIEVSKVPEPPDMFLLGIGLLALCGFRRRLRSPLRHESTLRW